MLSSEFFARDPLEVARTLLGKIIRHRLANRWMSAMIIEAEAYYLTEKGSHSSLGFTEKRKALFMPPGTIYMYYARGGDSINVSCLGEGNAVLIKAGIPYLIDAAPDMIEVMLKLNTIKGKPTLKPINKLCSGQTLLCRSLGLKVPEWNQQTFDPEKIRIDEVGYSPEKVIQTTRLGIPEGRDAHLPLRMIDFQYAGLCTSNPLSKKNNRPGIDYVIHEQS
ncbi:MAG: DNA-3-methyladenine glycosylase [Gammaproteobacteria bacterium]|nr:DNA-3-methyladenine glycosylase [Gammaproteobacteria bacterium]